MPRDSLPDQGIVIRALRDPLTVACVEADVEAKLRDHQESCGAYACDPAVIVTYVLDSLVDNVAFDQKENS